MATDQEASWAEYYRRLHLETRHTWLDLSNEAVQAQTFALAIEAAGAIAGRRCLDVGCGYGMLSTGLHGLGAGEVVGVDIVAEAIASCRRRYRKIRWECGSPSDATFLRSLGDFDIVFLVEVLQYVPWESTLRMVWGHVREGGRIVAVAPNRDNAIVQKTIARFDGTYLPPNPAELDAVVASLPDVEHWAQRGMDFQLDQGLLPYLAGPWVTRGALPDPANRVILAIMKREAEGSPG